eukprot:7194290-Pyramimonas_sp.AAC.1
MRRKKEGAHGIPCRSGLRLGSMWTTSRPTGGPNWAGGTACETVYLAEDVVGPPCGAEKRVKSVPKWAGGPCAPPCN